MRAFSLRIASVMLVSLGVAACGGGTESASPATPGSAGGGGVVTKDPGTTVAVSPSGAQGAEAERLGEQLSALSALDATGIASRYPTAFQPAPTYDASQVTGLSKIQGSSLKLSDGELAQLTSRGFVISQARRFPTFAYGYATIYAEHLPLYVSADSILYAVHRSYDDILAALETKVLAGELTQLLTGMRGRLADGVAGADAEAVADTDVYLAVALGLLQGATVPPVAGGSEGQIGKLMGLAQKANGTSDVALFGVVRKDEDFSQFEPRGHYTNSPELSRYFRAMMWLGRVDLRMLETQSDGSQLFRRRQLESTLLLHQLIDSALRPHFDRIDRTVAAFVGEADYMQLADVDRLLVDLKIDGIGGLADFSDQELAQTLLDGDYGAQRISSHIMMNGVGGTLPLSRSFALLGQRYTVDSHVFSNVVYDRVGLRMMPSPLDAAFAALQNDQAATLLSGELTKYEDAGYPAALAQMRLLVDDHPHEFWDGSLYNLWLTSLRQLSPSVTSSAADADTLFPVARTEAWGRRLLNTQLASWAELRHDTILYAKQSYTGGPSCDFPDGYVDPYPAFFRSLSAYGMRGARLLDELSLDAAQAVVASAREHFAQVRMVAETLASIAENERTGAELTPEMLAFINEAVVVEEFCGGAEFASGWYKRLFWSPASAVEQDPTIADVHTQPTDEGGAPVGKVLHVGTGVPRLMAVIADNCSGPHAYVGLASSYHEKITEKFERLTDEKWQETQFGEPDVAWMSDLVVKP